MRRTNRRCRGWDPLRLLAQSRAGAKRKSRTFRKPNLRFGNTTNSGAAEHLARFPFNYLGFA